MRIDNSTPQMFTRERADEIAAEMTAAEDGDGWTYRAAHDPKGTGWSRVDVFDEDDEKVGSV